MALLSSCAAGCLCALPVRVHLVDPFGCMGGQFVAVFICPLAACMEGFDEERV
jgi:hypothetical protein